MKKQIIKEEKVKWFSIEVIPKPSELMCSILVKLNLDHRNMTIPAFYADGNFNTVTPTGGEPYKIDKNHIVAWCYTPKFSSNHH